MRSPSGSLTTLRPDMQKEKGKERGRIKMMYINMFVVSRILAGASCVMKEEGNNKYYKGKKGNKGKKVKRFVNLCKDLRRLLPQTYLMYTFVSSLDS